MSWVKIDDGFPDNTKVVGITDRAFRLHVCALCHCARNLTDGHILPRALKTLLALTGATKRHVSELIAARLWLLSADGDYEIKDYLEYNPSARDVKQQRKQNADRQRRHRAKQYNAYDADVLLDEIAVRDRWLCHLCGLEVVEENAALDHVIPLAQGGRHHPENVRLSHRKCNERKNNRTLEQLGPTVSRRTSRVTSQANEALRNAAPSPPLNINQRAVSAKAGEQPSDYTILNLKAVNE